MIRFRNLSIFSRLLAALSVFGLAIALLSGAAHYLFAERLIKSSVYGQMQTDLESSIAYFERTYLVPIKGVLQLIESSPAINTLLSSSAADIYVARPDAERLFLSVSKGNPKLYGWLRLIDAGGVEQIVVQGNRRVRDYRSVSSGITTGNEATQISALFTRLSGSEPGTIAFAGPLQEVDGGYCMLVGIAKREPEIGGFGGAVIAKININDYLQYLAHYKVFGEPMVWVFAADGAVMLQPPADVASLNPIPYLTQGVTLPKNAHVVSSDGVVDGRTAGLMRIALVMSPETFHAQLAGAEKITGAIVAAIMLFSGLFAFSLARQVSRPVRALADAARAVGGGDLEARVDGQWGGEFSTLAETFNRMTETIGETTVSKAYVHDVVHSMSEALVVLDGCGAIQTVNQALLELLGYEEAELVGKPLGFIMEDSLVRETLGETIRACGTARGVETVYKSRSGELIPVTISVSPMSAKTGCCSGTVCVAHDIRERKRFELETAQRQRQSELQQQAIVRLATDISLIQGDLEAAASLATKLCAHAMRTARVSVWLLEADNGEMHCVDLFETESKRHSSGSVLSAVSYPQYFAALQSGRAIAAIDALNDPRTKEFAQGYLKPLGITSMLDAAIRVSGSLVGVVCLEHIGPQRNWSHEDIAFVSEVADQMTQVLTNRQRREMEDDLRASESRFRALYEDNPTMIFILDQQGMIMSVNRHGLEQLGYSAMELVGTPLFLLHSGGDQTYVRAQIKAAFVSENDVRRWEVNLMTKSGESIWMRETARLIRGVDGAQQVLLVCEDLTEVHRLSQRLTHQASHDALTGLLNRREFEDRLQRAIASAREADTVHALCYLDLDQFKIINDTCGHIAGDELLRQLSLLLGAQFRSRDSVARLGGDEFGVLMEHCRLEQAERTANAMREAIEEFQFAWGGRTFGLGCSVGLVEINAECAGITELMSAADSACYTAKDQGRNRVHIYSEEDEALAKRRSEMQWVARIRDALASDRFQLCYQSIVPTDSTVDVRLHYEILVRLVDENGDIVPPGAFLPAAERYNMSPKIDRWVIASTLKWLTDHPDHVEELGMCSINISGNSFTDEGFIEFVLDTFKSTGVPPEKICFEVTETAAISNITSAACFINSLKEAGCRFSLDDFGSGVSSFGYLKTLAVDYIKIDGMFVKDIVDDPIDRSIVRSINEVAHELGKQTIAEYVENNEILSLLRNMGVDYAQGYGIGRPQPLDQFETARGPVAKRAVP